MKGRYPEQIKEVQRLDAAVPKRINIDLSIQITDQVYDISGNMFYVWDAPAGLYVDIKVNEIREPAFSYVAQTGMRTPFKRLYITTPAGQIGTLVLIYATEAPDLIELIDNRAEVSANLAEILNQLQGDTTPDNWNCATVGNAAAVQVIAANVNRKSALVSAAPGNTGNVAIGFDNTVNPATPKYVVLLLPGQAWGCDDFRGDIYARATAAGQTVGFSEV